MWSLRKMKKYKKQNELIHEYALIIAKHTGLPDYSDEVQDAALDIYIKEHGAPVRMGP